MLIEIAIGDAYGAGFEYGDPKAVRDENDLTHYIKHPRHPLPPGSYTDDTQMSIAVAEAIVSGDRWTPLNLASRFVAAFKRDEREGYAQRFYAFLREVRDGEEFLRKIRPDSDKSGAAMRATPVGLFPTIGEVVDKCTVQAKLTHDTPDGVNAAVAAALTAHYFAYDLGPKADLGRFLESQVPGQWSAPWSGKVGAKGWMSVRAAITALMRFDRLSDILKACIAYTGDVDTVAAVAMGAASLSREVGQDLPGVLLAGLEAGPYGRAFLEELDGRLLGHFGLTTLRAGDAP